MRVVGLIEPDDARSRQALAGLVVADVATAQELLDRPGRLSRVDLAVPEGAPGEAVLARVRAALPPGAEVVSAAARSEFVGQLTRAFDVNLTALSLLALVVGLFLAYNTMTFSVVQRRATIGMVRALGVTRAEIVAVILAEALLLGLVATALGLALGVALARGLVQLVTRTINDLYFVVVVRDLAVSPAGLAKGAALGIGATLLAAIVPALEATAAPPGAAVRRVVLETRARRAAPRAAAAGVASWRAGALLVAGAGRSLAWSYAGLFAHHPGGRPPHAARDGRRAAIARAAARPAPRIAGPDGRAGRRRDAVAHRGGGGGAHGRGGGDHRGRRDGPELSRDGRELARDLAGADVYVSAPAAPSGRDGGVDARSGRGRAAPRDARRRPPSGRTAACA